MTRVYGTPRCNTDGNVLVVVEGAVVEGGIVEGGVVEDDGGLLLMAIGVVVCAIDNPGAPPVVDVGCTVGGVVDGARMVSSVAAMSSLPINLYAATGHPV